MGRDISPVGLIYVAERLLGAFFVEARDRDPSKVSTQDVQIHHGPGLRSRYLRIWRKRSTQKAQVERPARSRVQYTVRIHGPVFVLNFHANDA